MATVNAASTDAQVWAAYDDNSSFEEDNSAAKAAAFITACIILLRRRPQTISSDGQSVSFADVQSELNRARKWQAAKAAAGGVRHLDFRNLRY